MKEASPKQSGTVCREIFKILLYAAVVNCLSLPTLSSTRNLMFDNDLPRLAGSEIQSHSFQSRSSIADPIGSPAPDPDAIKTDSAVFALLPVGLLSPETSLGMGLMAILFDIPSGHEVDLLVLGTLKNQFRLRLRDESGKVGPFKNLKSIHSAIETQYYPLTYFGQTNSPQDDSALLFSPLAFKLNESLVWKVWSDFSILPSYDLAFSSMRSIHYVNTSVTPDFSDSALAQLRGAKGGWEQLLGLEFSWDSRDIERAASTGNYLGFRMAKTVYFSDYDYGLWSAWIQDYRNFAGLNWATQVLQEGASGRPPFYALPFLGDKDKLRGVSDLRLRGRYTQLLTLESRLPFSLNLLSFKHRLQIAAFIAGGRSGQTMDELWSNAIHIGIGGGGRLLLHGGRICVRGDLGFSEYGPSIYAAFGQAF